MSGVSAYDRDITPSKISSGLPCPLGCPKLDCGEDARWLGNAFRNSTRILSRNDGTWLEPSHGGYSRSRSFYEEYLSIPRTSGKRGGFRFQEVEMKHSQSWEIHHVAKTPHYLSTSIGQGRVSLIIEIEICMRICYGPGQSDRVERKVYLSFEWEFLLIRLG